ncbi:hypothetical protein LCGC14_0851950 [marine sediment metagenome]|uniref:Uncharacterized protein n=1 Tax=marine sediment metagenome TaxID=412755 RepID=A0A0F9SH31_9ZZZZ
MGLKTLKDLAEGRYMYVGMVQLRHVREEAIKWIKWRRSLPFEQEPCGHVEEWIKHFFNLKEADIKEEDLK